MRTETDRLHIRFAEECDCKEMTSHLQNEAVIAPLETPPMPFEYSDALTFYQMMVKTYQTNRPELFVIAPKNSDRLIGCIGLHPEHTYNARPDVAEFGYWLGQDFWRQGIMYEASLPVLHNAFHKMGWLKIVAQTNTDNIASESLLKKLGFHFIGERTRKTAPKRGTQTDHCWELTKENYLDLYS